MMKKILAFLTAFSLSAALFVPVPAAADTAADALQAGTYTIQTALDSTKVLDIAAGSREKGGNLQIYIANGSAAQQFTVTPLSGGYLLISPVCSGLALDVESSRAVNSANIRQYTMNGTGAQQWLASPADDGFYTLSPRCAPGFVMDVAAGKTANKTNVAIYKANGTKAQEFRFVSVDANRNLPEGSFTFASVKDSSKVIDIAAGSVKDRANVQLYHSNGSDAQKFFLTYKGSGWYVIRSVRSAKVLDVAASGTADGTNVQQYKENDTNAQLWKFISKGDGTYIIQSKLGKVLDIAAGRTEDKTNIRIYHANGSDAQLFSLLPVKAVQKYPKEYMVAIDAGHQLHADTGTEPIGPGSSVYKQKVSSGTYGEWSGLNEYELNLQVSLKLQAELIRRGYSVYMIRTTNNVDISNAQRAQLASGAGADILVRIHGNSVDDSSVRGAMTYEPSSENPYLKASVISKSQRLSQLLLSGECAATGLPNRGILYGDDMTGINWSSIPVTIVEMGFMSNKSDDLYLASTAGQAAIVQGLANGIDAYFG